MTTIRKAGRCGIAAAGLLLLLASVTAHAADWAACRAAVTAPQKVAACSDVIRTSRDPRLLERAHNRRGLAFSELQRYDEAIRDFDDVIRLNGRIAGYFDNRMYAWLGKGDPARALVDAEESVRLAPDYAFVWRSRAIVLEALGRYADSIRDFTSAVQINPQDAGLHVDRGRIYTKLGDLQAAIRDFTEAMQLNPAEKFALKQRGLAYISLGDQAHAAADLTAYLGLEPNDAEAASAVALLRR